jgi:hypothetical protein
MDALGDFFVIVRCVAEGVEEGVEGHAEFLFAEELGGDAIGGFGGGDGEKLGGHDGALLIDVEGAHAAELGIVFAEFGGPDEGLAGVFEHQLDGALLGGGDGVGRDDVGDDEVAVAVEGLDLVGGEMHGGMVFGRKRVVKEFGVKRPRRRQGAKKTRRIETTEAAGKEVGREPFFLQRLILPGGPALGSLSLNAFLIACKTNLHVKQIQSGASA